jgi:hypothetical protein
VILMTYLLSPACQHFTLWRIVVTWNCGARDELYGMSLVPTLGDMGKRQGGATPLADASWYSGAAAYACTVQTIISDFNQPRHLVKLSPHVLVKQIRFSYLLWCFQ